MKAKVPAAQRVKWKPLGHAMHFASRHKCAFHLAHLLERKIIISTIGEWRPNLYQNDFTPESLAGQLVGEEPLLYETFVFRAIYHGDTPLTGEQIFGERCHTVEEAYKLHEEMCVKFQLELNMGMHR